MYPGILRSGVTGTYHHRRWIRSLACFFHHGSIQTSGKSAPVSLCFAGQGHFGFWRRGINDPGTDLRGPDRRGRSRPPGRGPKQAAHLFCGLGRVENAPGGWAMRPASRRPSSPGPFGCRLGRRGTGTGRERDHRAASTKLWKICLLWSSFKRENSGCHWTAQT